VEVEPFDWVVDVTLKYPWSLPGSKVAVCPWRAVFISPLV
jgi:hypothetical protein